MAPQPIMPDQIILIFDLLPSHKNIYQQTTKYSQDTSYKKKDTVMAAGGCRHSFRQDLQTSYIEGHVLGAASARAQNAAIK